MVVTEGCFDEASQQLVVTEGGKVKRAKRYIKVVSWGAGDEGGGQ